MSRASFDSLCDKLSKQLQRNARVREVVSVELQVAVLLGLRVTLQLGTSSTVCVCVKWVWSAIVDELFEIYVKCPEGIDLTNVINGYKADF